MSALPFFFRYPATPLSLIFRHTHNQWIGLRENLQESPIIHGKIHGFPVFFSLKPIDTITWSCVYQNTRETTRQHAHAVAPSGPRHSSSAALSSDPILGCRKWSHRIFDGFNWCFPMETGNLHQFMFPNGFPIDSIYVNIRFTLFYMSRVMLALWPYDLPSGSLTQFNRKITCFVCFHVFSYVYINNHKASINEQLSIANCWIYIYIYI